MFIVAVPWEMEENSHTFLCPLEYVRFTTEGDDWLTEEDERNLLSKRNKVSAEKFQYQLKKSSSVDGCWLYHREES